MQLSYMMETDMLLALSRNLQSLQILASIPNTLWFNEITL